MTGSLERQCVNDLRVEFGKSLEFVRYGEQAVFNAVRVCITLFESSIPLAVCDLSTGICLQCPNPGIPAGPFLVRRAYASWLVQRHRLMI